MTSADPDPHPRRSHPTEPRRMYQGGGGAYYESRDSGANWRRELSGIPDPVRYFYSLAVDSGDPDNVLLSGARDPFSGHAVIPGIPVWSALYRLDGDRWVEVTDGTPPTDGTPMGTLAAGAAGVFYYVTDPGEIDPLRRRRQIFYVRRVRQFRRARQHRPSRARRRLRLERRMETPPNDFTLLRLAIQNLSCAPQAQRRYVQLGDDAPRHRQPAANRRQPGRSHRVG